MTYAVQDQRNVDLPPEAVPCPLVDDPWDERKESADCEALSGESVSSDVPERLECGRQSSPNTGRSTVPQRSVSGLRVPR